MRTLKAIVLDVSKAKRKTWGQDFSNHLQQVAVFEPVGACLGSKCSSAWLHESA